MPESIEPRNIPKPSIKQRITELFRKMQKKKVDIVVPEGAEEEQTKERALKVMSVQRPVEEQVEYEQLKAKAIQSLTDREREVYTLIYEEGLSNVDAARKLGVSASAIRQRRVSVDVKFRGVFRNSKW